MAPTNSGPESINAYDPSDLVKLLHETFPRPLAEQHPDTFVNPVDEWEEYGIKSVGTIGIASSGLLLLMLLFMWLFHCCMLCSCCKKKCYCAKCCCCNSKIIYFLFMLLGTAALAPGWFGRVAAQDALKSLKDGVSLMTDIIDGAEAKKTLYGTQMGDVKAIITAFGDSDCPSATRTSISDSLDEIQTKLEDAELPLDTATLEPLETMLEPYVFGDLIEEIPKAGVGFLTFALDALFVAVIIWTALLAFFACCAKCNFKMSQSGLCACLHTVYKFLVILFSSIILLVNLGLGGAFLVLATMMSDMCFENAADNLKIVTDEIGVEFPDGAPDPFWWFKCEGTHPLQSVFDAFNAPLTELVDNVYTPCLAGSPPCVSANQCAANAVADPNNMGLKDYLDPLLLNGDGSEYTAVLQKTAFDFTELFSCNGLNEVLSKFMFEGVCKGLVDTFFWLWVALTGSTFLIIIGFWLLGCNPPAKDDDDAPAKNKA